MCPSYYTILPIQIVPCVAWGLWDLLGCICCQLFLWERLLWYLCIHRICAELTLELVLWHSKTWHLWYGIWCPWAFKLFKNIHVVKYFLHTQLNQFLRLRGVNTVIFQEGILCLPKLFLCLYCTTVLQMILYTLKLKIIIFYYPRD